MVWGKMRKGDETSEQNSEKGTEEKLAGVDTLYFYCCDPKPSDTVKNLIFLVKNRIFSHI